MLKRMMNLNLISWELRNKLGIPTCQGYEGPCQRLGHRRRQNTAYMDEEDNYVHMCDRCFEQLQEYWDEMWSNVEGYR
jgi:hypothetical protein